MNFCLSDLVPPLRWSDASTITLLTGQPDLPDAWWRTLPMPHVLAAIGPESLGELLTEIALEHWPAAAVGDVLPALHVLEPDDADEPAVAIALDRTGSWTGLLALTSRELVDQPFVQARPVLNTLFSTVLVRLARPRPEHPAPAAEAAATVGPILTPAPAAPESAHGSEPVAAAPEPAQTAEEPPRETRRGEHASQALAAAHPAAAEQPGAEPSVAADQAGAGQEAVEAGELHGRAAEHETPHAVGERAAEAPAQFAAEPVEAARVAGHGAEAASAEPVAEPPAETLSPEPVAEPAAEAVSPEPVAEPAAEAVSPERVAEPEAESGGAAHGMESPGKGTDQPAEPRPENPPFEQFDQLQGEQAEIERAEGGQAQSEAQPPGRYPSVEGAPAAAAEQSWQPSGGRAGSAADALAPGEDVLESSPEGAEPVGAAGQEPEHQRNAAPEPEPQDVAAPQIGAAPEPGPQAHVAPEPEPEGDVAPVSEPGVVEPQPVAEAASGPDQPLPELIEAAFAGLDDKSWAVAQNRIFTDEPSAVDQLAKLFAVPPAEIAATEDELRARLDQWLASEEAAPYRAHLDDLVRTLGPAAPKEQLIGAADWHHMEIRALEVPAWQFVLATLAPQPQPQPQAAPAQQSQAQPQAQSAFGPVQAAPPPVGPPQFQAFAPVAPAGESNGDSADEAGQPYQPLKDVSQTRRCFRQPDGRWWLRIDVTAEQLAGGECALPTGFASYLGLSPGESRTVRSAAGELTMTWHGGPVLESIERLLVDVGAREGGHLFLTLSDEGVLRARHLPVAAQGAEKITKALRLVGYTAPGGTRDQAARVIATRIGMTGPVSLPDLLTRLRERGDRDLLALLD
ncbi:hypothetical protein [Nonomuraea diastatica]|uniref:Uncharacterized protein n=1 Tax=Nonomuraea diastatica TaxID=1848329 RepID=A0A4R4W9W7_9ACTN|nr:hypothetical protein [Nonomuraea diastatica]TDD15549.1 hypothetical protein E1294_34170 [Nonomuraea diastatica]